MILFVFMQMTEGPLVTLFVRLTYSEVLVTKINAWHFQIFEMPF